MRITPKEPGVIEAQVAQFASEHIKDMDTKVHILENLSSIAVGAALAPTDENLSEHDYTRFLTRIRQEGRADVFQTRSDIIASYGEFQEDVSRLKSAVDDGTAEDSRLGEGTESNVFQIDHDGMPYVVRMPRSAWKQEPTAIVDRHVAAAALTRGVPHFEQVVAASYEDGVTIAEIMPGKSFAELTTKDIEAITDVHLEELVRTLQEVDRLGLVLDYAAENFFYDAQAGFGIIDLKARSDVHYKTEPPRQLSYILSSAIVSLFDGVLPIRKSIRSRKADKAMMASVDSVLQRYKGIIHRILDEKTTDETISRIDKDMIDITELRKHLRV